MSGLLLSGAIKTALRWDVFWDEISNIKLISK
jgi:hypothetical protein